jgi:hypothetical protein
MNVDRRFAQSSSLRFLTFIYNAATATAAAISTPSGAGTGTAATPAPQIDLAVQIQVFRDNQPVITVPVHKIQTEGFADLARIPYAADVLLDDLKPGSYVLQVTIIDRLAKKSASRQIDFLVE